MPRSEPRYHPLNQSPFYALQSRARLAALFGLTRKTLDDVVAMDRPYSCRTFEEERHGKIKTRIIQEPRGALRPIHVVVRKALSRDTTARLPFCPVKRRSYVSNAAQRAARRKYGRSTSRRISLRRRAPV